MTRIYFDATDIVHYAMRNSTVVGIPRVEVNIIARLARKYGCDTIRCIFFDRQAHTMVEFDPTKLTVGLEFDAQRLLLELGLVKTSKIFPSKVQVKSYLKRYNNNKPLRTLKKIEVYLISLLLPQRLKKLGLTLDGQKQPTHNAAPLSQVATLPVGSFYVCLGAGWWLPQEVWQFGKAHKERGGTVVQMVYDLIPISHPDYYSAKEPPAFIAWLNGVLKYSSRIVCISDWTANDLRRYAKIQGHTPAISAIPLAHEFIGFDRGSQVDASTRVSILAGLKFVLCVGTIEHRKNGIALLQIWHQLIEKLHGEMPLLVFAGKYGKGGAEFQEFLKKTVALKRYVHVIHAPSDQELAWLYKNSLFSTYPSQFEGWGLPVGESAWFGKYCVASQATSIPEVCGDLMDYVDPHSTESIKASVERAIVDSDFLQRRENAIAEAKLRRWSDVADDIYNYVASSSNGATDMQAESQSA